MQTAMEDRDWQRANKQQLLGALLPALKEIDSLSDSVSRLINRSGQAPLIRFLSHEDDFDALSTWRNHRRLAQPARADSGRYPGHDPICLGEGFTPEVLNRIRLHPQWFESCFLCAGTLRPPHRHEAEPTCSTLNTRSLAPVQPVDRLHRVLAIGRDRLRLQQRESHPGRGGSGRRGGRG